MSDFKNRLQIEHNELHEKIEKLQAFITGKKFAEVDSFQQDLLIVQLSCMTTYLSVLGMRLNNLN